jgi:SAM-dependent methyltransferase
MLPEALRSELTRQFVHTYGAVLAARGLVALQTSDSGIDHLQALKQQTIENFGFEWTEYARFGWDDRRYNLQYEESVFRRKSLLFPQEVAGKLVLDAGCGNGRYTYWAKQYGGRVIGIDLGDGVESASRNTADLHDVQIVQADLFNLPFADGTFDVIFSIGVLMHTGDACKATARLIQKLKPGGSLTVHMYGKGNWIYEFVDRVLRKQTTKMSIPELQTFTARAFRLRQYLDCLHLASLTNRFVRLESHPHIIFDWYAAPIATHHTYREAETWFQQGGLTVTLTNEHKTTPHVLKRLLRSLVSSPTTVTVKGVSAL